MMRTNSRTFWQHALALMALMIVAGTTVLAQSPFSAPQRLSAEVSPASSGYSVSLNWGWFRQNQGGMSALPDGFKIYRADGIDSSNNGNLNFALVATVAYADASDSASPNGGFFRATDEVAQGDYTYYVVAYGANGAVSARSNLAWASARPAPPTITITNGYQIGAQATVGQAFSYDVNATASNGGTVRYRIIAASGGANTPDTLGDAINATIDPATGVVSWTPTAKGTYGQAYLNIEAYLQDDQSVSATCYLIISIRECQNPAIISGTINYEQGGALDTNGTVMLEEVLGNGMYRAIATHRLTSQGFYEFAVDGGTYVLSVHGINNAMNSIVDEWYDNAYSRDAAQQITLACAETLSVNMEVKKRTPARYFSITGTVTDQATGEALEAIVTAVGYDREIPADQAARTPVSYTTYAFKQGTTSATYSFGQLSDRYNWTLRAAAMSGRLQEDDRWIPIYFDNTSDATQASQITLTANRAINFALPKRTPLNNSISGTVQDRDGNALYATVVAYRITANNNSMNYWSTRTATTDSTTGGYTISDLSEGEYVLMSYGPYRTSNDSLFWYVPGYYKEGADAVSDWSDATRISVDENTNTSGRTITLLTYRQKNGTGRIRGTVAEGNGRTVKHGAELGGAKPIAGALVTAKTAEGEPVGAAYTNQNGEFELSGLPNGTLQLTISRVGYGAKKVEVNVEDGKVAEVPVEVKGSGTSGVETEMTNSAALAVLPNPATGDARISFVANGGKGEVSVLSLDGRVVLQQTINTVAGANSAVLDLAGTASGMYVVTLRTSDGVSATKLTVAR